MITKKYEITDAELENRCRIRNNESVLEKWRTYIK